VRPIIGTQKTIFFTDTHFCRDLVKEDFLSQGNTPLPLERLKMKKEDVILQFRDGKRTARPNNRPINDNIFFRSFVMLFILVAKYMIPPRYARRYPFLVLPGLPFFLKYGNKATVNLEEAHLTRYAGKMLAGEHVKIPKVYCAFEKNGCRYILLEKVKGQALKHQWTHLSPQVREKVIQKVRSAVVCMQKSKRSIICGLEDGPVFHPALPHNRMNDGECIGPFHTLTEFHKFMLDRHRGKWSYNDPKRTANFDHDFLRSPWCSDVNNFTHADLSPTNIMVDTKGRVAIVDWETAGWWPSYMENFMCRRYIDEDWSRMGLIVGEMIPVKEAERAMMIMFTYYFHEYW